MSRMCTLPVPSEDIIGVITYSIQPDSRGFQFKSFFIVHIYYMSECHVLSSFIVHASECDALYNVLFEMFKM